MRRYLQELDWLEGVAIPIHPRNERTNKRVKHLDRSVSYGCIRWFRRVDWLLEKERERHRRPSRPDCERLIGYLILIDGITRLTLRTLRRRSDVSQVLNDFFRILCFTGT